MRKPRLFSWPVVLLAAIWNIERRRLKGARYLAIVAVLCLPALAHADGGAYCTDHPEYGETWKDLWARVDSQNRFERTLAHSELLDRGCRLEIRAGQEIWHCARYDVPCGPETGPPDPPDPPRSAPERPQPPRAGQLDVVSPARTILREPYRPPVYGADPNRSGPFDCFCARFGLAVGETTTCTVQGNLRRAIGWSTAGPIISTEMMDARSTTITAEGVGHGTVMINDSVCHIFPLTPRSPVEQDRELADSIEEAVTAAVTAAVEVEQERAEIAAQERSFWRTTNGGIMVGAIGAGVASFFAWLANRDGTSASTPVPVPRP